ncbi:MAG: hypothetical protein ACFFDF_13775 [Candidatus Odinarchaeota archaeon]
MVNNKTLDELQEVYYNYKKGNYTFGKYGSTDQIKDAFLDGKNFVLTSSNRGFLALIIVFLIPIVFLVTSVGSDAETLLLWLFFDGIFFICISIFTLFLIIFLKRYFVVISPEGIYYRKIIANKYFQWSQLTLAERGIKTIRGYKGARSTIVIVSIILLDGKKVKFNSARYKSKEFVKIVKREMFVNLFQVYSELGKIKNMNSMPNC